MDSLSMLYLDTINPLSSYNRLCSLDVLCSIVLHTILYVILIMIIANIFSLNISSVSTTWNLKACVVSTCFYISMMLG